MNRSGKSRRSRLGQSLIEFTFVGIPMIFVLISIFEVSRGMWIYHTLAYSVKVGVRYASVHGINCIGKTTNAALDNPNNCPVNMGPGTAPAAGTLPSIAWVIREAAVGLDPNNTQLTFTSGATTTTCSLDACAASIWPPYDSTGVNTGDYVGQPIQIDIRTPFTSAITMFWTGTSKSVHFASGTLGASSQDYVQF